MFNYLIKKTVNYFSFKTERKLIVFESDDWGALRTPVESSFDQIRSKYPFINNDPYSNFDSLESADDLYALYDVLQKYKDINGNYPIITFNTIVANPNFDLIKQSKFTQYFWEPFTKTIENQNNGNDCLKLWRDGIQQGFILPQFHGREHLNVQKWLYELENGNTSLLDAFDYNCYSIPFQNSGMKRKNLMAALDNEGSADQHEFQSRFIIEGLDIFNSIFSFNSKSFIAPAYIWSRDHEYLLSNNGVAYLQGIPIQYDPNSKKIYKKRLHYTGQKNKFSQTYLVRNAFFEPSIYNSKDWVADCLKRVSENFNNKQPSIIGCHRINFMGSLNEENRKKSLLSFNQLLSDILKKWPDVEFVSSAQLGSIISH